MISDGRRPAAAADIGQNLFLFACVGRVEGKAPNPTAGHRNNLGIFAKSASYFCSAALMTSLARPRRLHGHNGDAQD